MRRRGAAFSSRRRVPRVVLRVGPILRQGPERGVQGISVPQLTTVYPFGSRHSSFLNELIELGDADADVSARQVAAQAARGKAVWEVGLFAGHGRPYVRRLLLRYERFRTINLSMFILIFSGKKWYGYSA